MEQRRTKQTLIAALAVTACFAAFAADAQASCVTIGGPRGQASAAKWSVPAPDRVAPSFSQVGSARDDEADSIVGLWHAVFTTGGQIYDEGFDQWHSDGTEILNDNGVPPVLGNVCLGVWKKTGPRTYKLKHPVWNFDANGTLLGTIIIRELVTLRRGGNEYRGTFTFDFLDMQGMLIDQVAGDLKGTRITVD